MFSRQVEAQTSDFYHHYLLRKALGATSPALVQSMGPDGFSTTEDHASVHGGGSFGGHRHELEWVKHWQSEPGPELRLRFWACSVPKLFLCPLLVLCGAIHWAYIPHPQTAASHSQ